MKTQDEKKLVALVTGATSGIGKATALVLAARGMSVLVHGRDATRGGAVVSQIRAAGGDSELIEADLTSPDAGRELGEEALRRGGGRVDVLVNNAGVFPFGPTESVTRAQFDDVYAANVRAPFLLVGVLGPRMASRGRGHIVNVTTMAAHRVVPGAPLYGSSKAALGMLTKYWASEYGPRGVRVNDVSPGPTRTEGAAPFGEGLDQLGSLGLLKRVATPDEIARAIAFLVSDDASYVQGASLGVDGGYHAA